MRSKRAVTHGDLCTVLTGTEVCVASGQSQCGLGPPSIRSDIRPNGGVVALPMWAPHRILGIQIQPRAVAERHARHLGLCVWSDASQVAAEARRIVIHQCEQ